jgi:uncharacterized protein (TIGR03083 family)
LVLDARCDALAELWDTWATTVATLPDDSWFAVTRLPGWDVTALVAHHSLFPHAIESLASRPVDGPATIESAAALLRRFNEPDGAATRLSGTVADQARDVASNVSHDELAARFRDGGPRAIAAARDAGPIVVDYFGHATLPLAEALWLALLEATVHLLDLQRAIGRAPDVPEAGLRATATLLAQVPEAVAFVEAATGRTGSMPLPFIR